MIKFVSYNYEDGYYVPCYELDCDSIEQAVEYTAKDYVLGQRFRYIDYGGCDVIQDGITILEISLDFEVNSTDLKLKALFQEFIDGKKDFEITEIFVSVDTWVNKKLKFTVYAQDDENEEHSINVDFTDDIPSSVFKISEIKDNHWNTKAYWVKTKDGEILGKYENLDQLRYVFWEINEYANETTPYKFPEVSETIEVEKYTDEELTERFIKTMNEQSGSHLPEKVLKQMAKSVMEEYDFKIWVIAG